MKKIAQVSTATLLLSLLATSVVAEEVETKGHKREEVKADKVVAGRLYVQDKAKFFCDAHVEKDLEVDGKLDVDGYTDLGGNVDAKKNLRVHENLEVKGCAEVCNNLYVRDDVAICGNLLVNGDMLTRCCVEESEQKLYEAFQEVDRLFNEKCCVAADEIKQCGYFSKCSSTIVYGPFTPDICGHIGHALQPGAAQAFGKYESAELEAHFLGAFLNDPYFSFCDCACAPKICHHFPKVTAVINNELVNIASRVDVHYPGEEGPVVATVHTIGQYRLRCDKDKVKTPKVVWSHSNVSYNDCGRECLPCGVN